MNTRNILLLLSAVFIVALVCVLTFQTKPPQVMTPVLSFSELCNSNEAFGRYYSVSNDTGVSVGDVFEEHVDIEFIEAITGNKQSVESSYFNYSERTLHANFQGPSGKEYNVSAFYDGRQEFKIRAFLDEPGEWRYTLYFGDIILKALALNIAHADTESKRVSPILIDPVYPSKLISGGVPFYWVGGKWIASQNIAPCSIPQFEHLRPSHQPISDQEYLAYLDVLLGNKHNAILIKIAQFPLLDDGLSWDLEWLQRADWMVREALERGIYVQINVFDTWSRDQQYKVLNSTKGEEQVFNVWQPTEIDFPKIKQYLHSLASRFSAYPNVVWELGNEMEHSPNCGDCFVKQANQYYIPWLREFDVFDRLIGLSEGIWEKVDVDMGFAHQTRSADFETLPKISVPLVMNELVFSDGTAALWKDQTIRDSDARIAYRRTFWRSFMLGLSGSFEATWLNIQEPLNSAVENVMRDHRQLVEFIRAQNVDVNSREVYPSLLQANQDYYSYSINYNGGKFAAYLLSKDSELTNSWLVSANLPPGFYEYYWLNPVSGVYSDRYFFKAGVQDDINIDYEGVDLIIIFKRIVKAGME